MKLFSPFLKFIKLQSIEKKLFFEAIQLNVRIRVSLIFFPFHLYVQRFGIQHKELISEPEKDKQIAIELITKAVRRSFKYLPFNKKCLIEALITKQMLKKRRIESTIFLGVSLVKANKINAHAWLKSGSLIITGKNEMEKYKALEWYT